MYIVAHKIISSVLLTIIIGLGYWGYGKVTSTTGQTRYVLSQVAKNTIISSVASSGQVSALNQVAINPTVSGTLIRVNIKPGDKVAAGQTLFVIDDTNAQKSVRDAEISLQNANLSLQKLQLQNSDTSLNTTLVKAYDDGFTSTSNSFLDLPSIMDGLTNMFFKSDPKINGQLYLNWYAQQVGQADQTDALTFQQNLNTSYQLALTAYNANLADYKTISRGSDSTKIETLINETYNTTKLLANAIKDANNYIDFVNSSMQKYNFNTPSIIATHKASLNTYTSQVNSHLSDLLSAQTTITNDKNAFPSNDLSTQSAQISIKQAQNSLLDAQQTLSDYYIKAPFDGVIASVPVIRGDNVGSGTTLGTIITSKELATITLNEVDVAKIALGEKATLTFSAVPDLTITGQVAQIDSLGTVSQGVVNYGVKISFDTSDSRIKPGMSVDAEIITKVAQNVLVVPNSAVKTKGGVSYVQMFDTALPAPTTGVQGSVSAVAPKNQTVEVGISDATSTEITSGLKEGDEIVTKTITSTTATTTATPSILGSGSNKGTGALRIGG